MSGNYPPPSQRREYERTEQPPRAFDLSTFSGEEISYLAEVTSSRINEADDRRKWAATGYAEYPIHPGQKAVSDAFAAGIDNLIHQDIDKARQVIYSMAASDAELRKFVAAEKLKDLLWYEHGANDDEHIPTTAGHLVDLLRQGPSWDIETDNPADIACRAMIEATNEGWLRPDIEQSFEAELAALPPISDD